jgi:hypothetical protein
MKYIYKDSERARRAAYLFAGNTIGGYCYLDRNRAFYDSLAGYKAAGYQTIGFRPGDDCINGFSNAYIVRDCWDNVVFEAAYVL